ncbi:hypothetical protein [Accumulibacter sp.]|nr:hypothetical protein [Accumulibacter sp.]
MQAARKEVDPETGVGTHMVYLVATAQQRVQHRRFERVTDVGVA